MADQMKAIQSVSVSIDEYIKTLTDRINAARDYATEQQVALQFVLAFPEAMPPPPDEDGYMPHVTPRTRAALSLDSGCVQGFMLNYDALTLAEVTEPLRWLAERLGKYEISDFPEIHRRSYIFNGGRFHFQVFFGSQEGSICKFVQVGVKEEPQYELRCEAVN